MAEHEITGIARRYAAALFELALEADALAAVEADVQSLRNMIEDSADLRRLMASPLFGVVQQTRALEAIMDRAEITGLVANFMKLVARNRRLFAAPDMLKAFQEIAARHRGETIAVVTSAEPLSEEQTNALREALAAKAGGTVKLETHVDPSLIGGLIVRMGSQMIDTSVRTRLAGLRTAMKEAA